jgi:alpha-ketoglutarate-dependent 2,4-dichlorophenoxyacetate dioxygenase
MPFSLLPLHPLFAAEVSGIDLRRLPHRDAFDRITTALDQYAVLVFREQLIDDDQQIAFSRQFGRLETAVGRMRRDRKQRLPNPEVADVSNLDENDAIRPASDSWRMFQLANQLWHTDSSFKRVSGKLSLLSAREVPPTGGETEFADLRAAYEALDAGMRARLEGLVAEHSIFHSRRLIGYTDFSEEERAALPPVPQPLVRVHAGSGRKTLYLSAHAAHIIGWPMEEGRALLAELTAFATQPRFVHQHRWRVGDLVIWDNHCTLHRGRPFDDASARRDMRRTTVQDAAPALQQAGAALPAAS